MVAASAWPQGQAADVRSRVVVALIGIPLVYVVTVLEFAGNLLFALTVGLVSLIALAEFYSIARRHRPYVPAGLLVAIVTPLLTWRAFEAGLLIGLMLTIPLTLIFLSLSVRRDDQLAAVAVTFFGVMWIVLGAALILNLRLKPNGLELVFLLLVGTWLTDTGAFFVGRAVGRRKLAPRLSPNKTVEGLVGGLVLGTFAVWFGHFLVPEAPGTGAPWLAGTDALMLGIIVSTATVVGDLFESMVKRAIGVKDASHLLGGHGGMLDRIDSLLVSGPAMYAGAFIIGAF